jgi:large conductance mechanosensitive channel
MLKGFKEFILKGNAIDTAVGVVVGVAFGNVIAAIVKDLITPLIAAFGGQPDFSKFTLTINNSNFLIGDFVNSLFSFLMVSAVVYFGVIVPMNRLTKRINSGKSVDPTEKACPECLSLIPIEAKRCKFCTSKIN